MIIPRTQKFIAFGLPALSPCLALTVQSELRQAVHGFGASGAWWPNDLALFPDDVRANVSQLLFNQTAGLGLTDYRYNLGGGGVGVGTFSRIAETPYFGPRSDGVYNWSADPQGTYFLREAARFDVPIITLFVNSAPPTFTSNSQSCGGTLITERIGAYATYLTDVVAHWKGEGVHISYVSPMNEPDNNFDDGDPSTLCGQEGMQVLPSQRAEVVTTIAAALQAAGLDTKVIADESSSTGTFSADAPVWLSPSVGQSLAAVAHHQYGFATESGQVALGDQARNLSGGTPTWFTEICCYTEINAADADDPLATITYGAKYDPTMVSAMRMGNLIFESLLDMYVYSAWVALSSGFGSCTPSDDASCATTVNYVGYDDGLIYYAPDYSNASYYELFLTKRYTVLQHFTKAAPVGAIVRSVASIENNWRAIAFDYPEGVLHSIVAMNAQWAASNMTIVGDGVEITQPVSMFMSGPEDDYVGVVVSQLGTDGALVIEASEMSMYTIFF
ncbi:glycoside hydrolase family 30 protein [Plicaturopsis crispa FD-325 SS-3]|nr:glycoside hydrolase family 30 protein [Plicaturopsis crispa FD-325 SS-3]